MLGTDSLKTLAFLVVTAVVIASVIADWFRKYQARVGLADRQTFDDEQFKRAFYGGDTQRADTAMRVRKVLSKNVELSLDSLRPEDRLNDDLNVQIEANPALFWELEEEFGICTRYEDLAVFEETTEKLTTFSDLVEYVCKKVKQAETEEPVEKEKMSLPELIYDNLVEIVPPACLIGLAFGFVGDILGIDSAFRLGSGIFMLGIVLIIISIFSMGIETLTTEIRDQGSAWVKKHPFRTAWIGFIVVAMLYMSFAMLRWIAPIFTNST